MEEDQPTSVQDKQHHPMPSMPGARCDAPSLLVPAYYRAWWSDHDGYRGTMGDSYLDIGGKFRARSAQSPHIITGKEEFLVARI